MNKLFVFVVIGVFFIISHVNANDPVSYTKRAEFKQIYYFEQQKLKQQAVENFRAIKKEITDPKTKKVNRKHSLYKKYVIQQRKAQTDLKSEFGPRVQEKRYRDQVGASVINRKRIEMNAELKEITQRRELELKNKNIKKGTPEFDAVKNAWQEDFKQTRSKYAGDDKRYPSHEKLLKDNNIDPKDMRDTGSRPSSIQSDLDFSPKTNAIGQAYVDAYHKGSPKTFIEERADRWILHDTDTVIWKTPVDKKLGSSSYDAEISNRAQKNSDAFSTTGGLEYTSNGEIGIKDSEGAVLANANKFSDAIDPNHRDLSTAAKSVYKSQDASGRTDGVDPEFREQLKRAYKDKGTSEEVHNSFGDTAAEKAKKENDFYDKATNDIAKSYQKAAKQTEVDQQNRRQRENDLLDSNKPLAPGTDLSEQHNQRDKSNSYKAVLDADKNVTGYVKTIENGEQLSTPKHISSDEMRGIASNKIKENRVIVHAENSATKKSLADRDPAFAHKLSTGETIEPVYSKNNNKDGINNKDKKLIGYKNKDSGKMLTISEAKSNLINSIKKGAMDNLGMGDPSKGKAVGAGFKGINIVSDILDIGQAVTTGVNRALDEENEGDHISKTWGKATLYSVWENSMVKGILDGVEQVDINIKKDIDEMSREERESGAKPSIIDNYFSFIKSGGSIIKHSAKFGLDMIWGMTVGAVETIGQTIGTTFEEQTRGYDIDEKEEYANKVAFLTSREAYVVSLQNNKILKEASLSAQEENDSPNEETISEAQEEAVNNEESEKSEEDVNNEESDESEEDAFGDVDEVSTENIDADTAWDARQQIAKNALSNAQAEENSVSQHQQGIKNERDADRREFVQGLQVIAQGLGDVAGEIQRADLELKQQVAANNAHFSGLSNRSSNLKNALDDCIAKNKGSNPYVDINAIRYNCGQQLTNDSGGGGEQGIGSSSSKPRKVAAVNKPVRTKIIRATKMYYAVYSNKNEGGLVSTFEAINKQYGRYKYANGNGDKFFFDSSMPAKLDEINEQLKEGTIRITVNNIAVVLVDDCVVEAEYYEIGMTAEDRKLYNSGWKTGLLSSYQDTAVCD
ncbi:MAG: hypothetical protein ACI9AT_001654 [Ulvibacter sp.]|jgi:hypothetical protein